MLALIGAVAAIVGSLGPWATLTTGFGSLTLSGGSRDGQITAPLSIIAAAFIAFRLWGSGKGWTVLLALAVTGLVNAVTFYDWRNIEQLFDENDPEFIGIVVEVGWGLVIATIGSGWAGWFLIVHWWRGEIVRAR